MAVAEELSDRIHNQVTCQFKSERKPVAPSVFNESPHWPTNSRGCPDKP